MRALIVDDSKTVRSILKKILREWNFEVVDAGDGREAWHVLDTQPAPDLITVNWQMPEMDGLQLIRSLRSDSRFRKTPLLMISSQSDPRFRRQVLAAGADAFLIKPCDRRSVGDFLHQAGLIPGASLEVAVSRDSSTIASVATQQPSLDFTSPSSKSPPQPSGIAATDPHRERRPTLGSPQSGSAASGPPGTPVVRPIRILLVDDAVVVRRMLSNWLGEDAELEVAGAAADGQAALDVLDRVAPDVVLLDVEMPRMNGIETLRALRQRYRHLPVIMFSSLTDRGAATTMDALFLGANDYVLKPGGPQMANPETGRRVVHEQLVPKIKLHGRRGASQSSSLVAEKPVPDKTATDHSTVVSSADQRNRGMSPRVQRIGSSTRPRAHGRIDVLAIAASTGGPPALARLLSRLPKQLGIPILIVQHMPPVFTRYLADRLAADCGLEARELDGSFNIGSNTVWIAPGGRHMVVAQRGGGIQVELNDDPPENACRPSADVLFRSVAECYAGRTLAVVLTGMGQDGLVGCRRLHEVGAQILAQDEATSVVWGMPGYVARDGIADAVLPLDELGEEVARRMRCGRS